MKKITFGSVSIVSGILSYIFLYLTQFLYVAYVLLFLTMFFSVTSLLKEKKNGKSLLVAKVGFFLVAYQLVGYILLLLGGHITF
ncbi:MAG TPA: hypothetical protein VGO21_02210 [Candidatus Paceibacterota bacterium]|jgi:hypothetical protein|nr:hypothetical protein [Candidatus Paceibacterota bacterium]